jgi:thiosulfate dehydrogenase
MHIRNHSLVLILALAYSSPHSYGHSDSAVAIEKPAVSGPLIPATETMATAWDYPRNPMIDSLPGNPHLAAQIKLGFKIFTNTPTEANRISGNHVACNNCHLNAGQKEKAMALVGVSTAFPEYNKRAGRR